MHFGFDFYDEIIEREKNKYIFKNMFSKDLFLTLGKNIGKALVYPLFRSITFGCCNQKDVMVFYSFELSLALNSFDIIPRF